MKVVIFGIGSYVCDIEGKKYNVCRGLVGKLDSRGNCIGILMIKIDGKAVDSNTLVVGNKYDVYFDNNGKAVLFNKTNLMKGE